MKWSTIYSLSVVHYGTRKYDINSFDDSAWAMYKGKEYFVRGFFSCPKYGQIAALKHPTDEDFIKIVLRSELTIL